VNPNEQPNHAIAQPQSTSEISEIGVALISDSTQKAPVNASGWL
jgi:hypothetical protein